MTLRGDSSEAERYREAQNLTRSSDPDFLGVVRRYLADPSWRVRRAAWESLLRTDLESGVVQDFLLDCLDTDDAGVRTASAEALLSLGPEAVPAMLTDLSKQSVRVRKAVLDLLARIRDERAQSTALVLLDTDPDENVRFSAAEVLGAVGDAAAARTMLDVLPSVGTSARFSILSALDRIACRAPFPVKVASLSRYMDDLLCADSVVRLLGRLGDAEAGPVLWDFIVSRQHAAAIEAMAMFLQRVPDFQPAASSDQITALVQRASADAAPLLRQQIFQIVAAIDPLRLPELITSLVESDIDWIPESLVDKPASVVRSVIAGLLDHEHGKSIAANLLGERVDLEGEPALLALLSEAGPHRVETLRALGNVGTKRSAPHLLAYCGESDPWLAEAAAASLVRMADRKVEGIGELLTSAMDSSAPQVMVYLLPALGRLDGAGGARAVATAMRHADAAVRRAAVMVSVPYAGDTEVERLLLSRLADEDDEVRSAAAAACGEAGISKAHEVLSILLGDPNPWCQATALRAMSQLGAPPATDHLISILERGGVVAAAAASLVGAHDFSEFFPRLQRLLYSLEDDAVAELVKALSVYSQELGAETLEWLFRHEAWNVRLALAAYIGLKRKPWMLVLVRHHLDQETDGLVRMAFDELVD